MTLEEKATEYWLAIRRRVYSSSEPIINWVKKCFKRGYEEGRKDTIDKAHDWALKWFGGMREDTFEIMFESFKEAVK